MLRYVRFNSRLLFLLTAIVAISLARYRYVEMQRRELMRTIVDVGGTFETKQFFIPLFGDRVNSVVLPGASMDKVDIGRLKLFTFLERVRIEDVSLSGELDGEPWAMEGSFEFDGAPPPLQVVAHRFVTQQMRARKQ